MSLNPSDVDRFLRLLPALYEPRQLHAFFEHSLRLVRNLVACDQACWVTYEFGDRPRLATLVEAIPVASPGLVALLARALPKHPLATTWARARCFVSLMISNIPPPAPEGHRGECRDVCVQFESTHDPSTPPSGASSLVVGLGLIRRTHPFTDADRALITLLRPHLARALENSRGLVQASDTSRPILDEGAELALVATLTPRERDVAYWVTRGKTNAETGMILGASSRTVEKHVEQILRKLGVENRTAAAIALSKWSTGGRPA